MIIFKQKGNLNKTEKFIKQALHFKILHILEKYGQEGVAALSASTPVDSSLTANSWGYEIKVSNSSSTIVWTNSNVVAGVPLAVLLQYGHATRNGGYIQGRDFINPAIQPIFDRIAEEAWKEVTKE